MERKKNTSLIVLTDHTAYGDSAVRHGASLAVFFEAALIVISRFSFFTKNNPKPAESQEFRNILSEYEGKLKITVSDESFNPTQLHHFADRSNSIMFVIGVSRKSGETFFNRRRAIRLIKPSRLPVLAVGKEPPRDEHWQHVMISVGVQRREKEKALWAGYFNRFGGATVHLLHTVYKDEFLKINLAENLAFIDKLYNNLEIKSLKHEIRPRTDDLDNYAIAHAEHFNGSLLVVMTTTFKTFIDLIFGTREKHLIANKSSLPVLCINERDDLYVLCT